MSKRRRKKKTAPILSLLLVLLAAAGGYLWQAEGGRAQPLPQDGSLSLVVLDVGQGDSLLLHSGGQWALVDAGTAESEQAILQAMQDYGVDELALAVATHPHADHIGSMAAVLDAYPPGTFWMPDASHTSDTYERMLDAVERSGADAVLAETGDTFTLGDARITVLSPGPGDEMDDLNNASLVLLCEGAGARFLLTGDAEAPVEERLVRAGLPNIDVLKVGHHGSDTSSSEAFLDAAAPRFAAISCGVGNSYGHPHEQTLRALEERGCPVYRTDTQGDIIFTATGGEIDVQTER